MFNNYGLLGMGVVFASVGLINKDKWKKEELQGRKKAELILLLGVAILIGVALLYAEMKRAS